EAPPPGWSGKLHALETGLTLGLETEAQGAEPFEWLLFTDADIQHPPGSLRALLQKAREGPYDLVSIMVRLRAKGFWEKLLIRPFVYFFQLLYPFRRVSDPASGVAAAAGGCLLVRRSLFEWIGGFKAMPDAVIDDVTLAQRIKMAGGRCWLGLDPEMLSIRAYERLGDIVQMVSRTAFVQLGFRYSLVLGTSLFLGLFFTALPLLFLIALLD